jgi:hypothetical protein
MAVYALLKQTKMVVDYTKVGLSLSQVEWSRRDVMSDTLGDLTVVASRFV